MNLPAADETMPDREQRGGYGVQSRVEGRQVVNAHQRVATITASPYDAAANSTVTLQATGRDTGVTAAPA